MSNDHAIEPAIKPPYLGLLNKISIAERNAGRYLKAWADVTPDPDLRRALSLVAARETTHGDVFRQRIERLGFSLLDQDDDAELAERLRVLGDPARSDAEKVRSRRRDAAAEAAVDAFFASLDDKVATSPWTRSRATRSAGSYMRSATPVPSSARPIPASRAPASAFTRPDTVSVHESFGRARSVSE
jgi:hypothetical protein